MATPTFKMGDGSNLIAWVTSRIVTIAVAFLILLAVFGSYSIVEPGNTGVVFNIWTGSLRSTGQGLVWRIPWITRVQSYPTALRTYTMVMRVGEGSSTSDDSIDLPTKEGQHIKQDISITYNTSEEKAAEVFKAFRGADMVDIENTYIRRTTITIAQNAAGQMSLTEIISSKRTDFQNAVQETLLTELEKMGFHLDKVNLGASHLPAVIETQMQQKMAVQQQAEQAEYELQKQTTLAKAAVAEATGEAQALLVKAKAQSEANRLLQASITSTLVKYKAIEKWNGILPQVTGGNTPFIDLKGMSAAKADE
jgi:regulator of protease activity HflC (stomatin/prohibitin superfamily)